MYGVKLTDNEIKHRLTEWRNYKRLYPELKAKFDELLAAYKQLESDYQNKTADFEKIIVNQNARITELETMVFGRKPRGKHQTKLRLTTKRAAAAYFRPVPPSSAITSESLQPVCICKHCGGALTDVRKHVRYIEDVVIAAMSHQDFKTVEKQIVERGWCRHCGQYTSGADLRGQAVILGPQVKALVTYLSTIEGLTYDQIRTLLTDLYKFSITDGEITKILDSQRLKWLPEYEHLRKLIRAGPAHLDESRYPIQSEMRAGFVWTMTSALPGNSDVVFRLADSRTGITAKDLVGKGFNHIGITDRYRVYKRLFSDGKHQICWAHLQRTARDLTRLECLDEETLESVTEFYRELAGIYSSIRKFRAKPFVQETRDYQANMLLEQVTAICEPNDQDIKKLHDLKAGILEYQDCLFLCLTVDGIPADNNKAERSLRRLVLKRKQSFGVKTPKGARTLEVLQSVCWSLWYRDRDQFFPKILKLSQEA